MINKIKAEIERLDKLAEEEKEAHGESINYIELRARANSFEDVLKWAEELKEKLQKNILSFTEWREVENGQELIIPMKWLKEIIEKAFEGEGK